MAAFKLVENIRASMRDIRDTRRKALDKRIEKIRERIRDIFERRRTSRR